MPGAKDDSQKCCRAGLFCLRTYLQLLRQDQGRFEQRQIALVVVDEPALAIAIADSALRRNRIDICNMREGKSTAGCHHHQLCDLKRKWAQNKVPVISQPPPISRMYHDHWDSVL